MIRVVIATLVVLGAGCFSVPDYDGTRFDCSNGERCPPGQDCVAGTCRSDQPTGDGVSCAVQTCDLGLQCCFNGFDPASCIPAIEECPGSTAFCDGIEDCSGDYCCYDGATATCCGDDFWVVCQDVDDCTQAEPECCFDDPDLPWGTCSSVCF